MKYILDQKQRQVELRVTTLNSPASHGVFLLFVVMPVQYSTDAVQHSLDRNMNTSNLMMYFTTNLWYFVQGWILYQLLLPTFQNVSLKFKSSFQIWNLDKCSYCPEWTFYGSFFFFIDLKFSFEFIWSLFEDFLTTSRYWSFSNKTQLNWALKWFISNRIFWIYLCFSEFIVDIVDSI